MGSKGLKAVVVEKLGVKEDQCKDDAKFVEDLGADSLDQVELVMALEEEFGLEVTDEDAENIRTIKDIVTYVETRTEHAA